MKNSFQQPLLTILGIAVAHFLVACAPNGNHGLGIAPGQSQAPSPTGGMTVGDRGTQDSGGGTGVEGKVFESYIVNPATLPAYTQYLKPLLANIKYASPNDGNLDQVFNLKTWYIAPVELQKIKKNVLGISFINSETEQIARQTKEAVWIDKRIFDKMASKDQSELILHEMVMNFYLMKFLKISEICRMVPSPANKKSDCTNASFDKMMGPETEKPLTAVDNENIRYVTGWMLQNLQKPTENKALATVMYNHGFDRRFFNPENYDDQIKRIENPSLIMSGKEIIRSVKGAGLSGNTPEVCYSPSTGKSKPCKIEIEDAPPNTNGSQSDFVVLKISMAGEETIRLNLYWNSELRANGDRDLEGNVYYSDFVTEIREKYSTGDRVYTALLFFKKTLTLSKETIEFDSLFFEPGVIVSIDKTRDHDICQLRTPRGPHMFDAPIVAHRADVRNNGMDPIDLSFTLGIPPLASCSPDNVIED